MSLDSVKRDKEKIRREIKEKLKGLARSSREEWSRRIQEKFISSEGFKVADVIMTYVALPTEVDTEYLIKTSLEMGKKVVVPFIDNEHHVIIASELRSISDLEKGPYDISVPKNGPIKVCLKEIDIIVVPGIAFDKKNMRLGRGKGYYDRFLALPELSSSNTVGFAYGFQIVDHLPSDPHDKAVSAVLTE